MKLITLKQVKDWQACYENDKLAALFDRPHTPLEVLTRTDGAWADVPANDRIWVICHKGVVSDRTLRLFACDCADAALAMVDSPDPRSVDAVRVARLFADGKATARELAAARNAARDAAWAAAWAVAWAAAWTVAREAAWTVAREAAREAAGDAQIKHLIRRVTEEQEQRDER